jgi:2'-5' RNA ligase
MDIEAARQSIDRVFMPEFDVTLSRFETFDGRRISRDGRPHRPLVIKAEGERLYELFTQVCSGIGLRRVPKKKDFKPHLSVSYGPEGIEYQEMPPLVFRAREILLIHSEVGLSRYHVVHRRLFLIDNPIDNKQWQTG